MPNILCYFAQRGTIFIEMANRHQDRHRNKDPFVSC